MSPSNTDKLIAIGRVIKARGLRGELKIKPLTDFLKRFACLDTVKVELKNGQVMPFEVESARINGGIVIIKLKGIDSRDAADALRGAYISVTLDEVVPLDEDSFYIFELEGMDVYDTRGERIGTVIRVEKYPANDVLVVETKTTHIMIPAIKKFVIDIDIKKRQLTVDISEGLPVYPKG